MHIMEIHEFANDRLEYAEEDRQAAEGEAAFFG